MLDLPLPTIVAALVATAGSFFALGAYYQHYDVLRNIQRLEQRNAHAYFIRRKLYALLSIFSASDIDNAQKDADDSHKLGSIMKYGFPSMDEIRLHDNYVTSYDRRNSAIHWLCERVESDSGLQATRGHASDSYVLQTQATWSGSHKVTGVPTVAFFNQSEAARVFFLSNIKPFLNRGFNLNVWDKLLSYVSDMAVRHDAVYVYTGSIYLPKEVKANSWHVEFQPENSAIVAVPTHFFKIIIVDPKVRNVTPYAEAFVVPNAPLQDTTNVRSLLSDIRDIENATGLLFFEGLERNFISTQGVSDSLSLYQNGQSSF